MKVIITNTFDRKFLNKLKKYFSVLELVNELKREKSAIVLKDPFCKIKLKLNYVDFRGVVLFVHEDKIIPLMLYLKKDKNNWENIIWNLFKTKILESQLQASKDLENWKFKVY